MLISNSDKRTANYKKQIKLSFIFKILSAGCSFLIIPLMIDYLGTKQYGVWSTLLSIISWITLFDIGIGNGLKNKITEAIAKNKNNDVKAYITTAYLTMGFICLSILILLYFISNFVNWQLIFNITDLTNQYLKNVIHITLFFFIINFWLSLINQILNSLQMSSFVNFNQLLSNVFSLIFVFVLKYLFVRSLLIIAIAYSLSLIFSNIIFTIIFFKKNKVYIPNIKSYNISYIRDITSLGLQFFIIQIAVIILFSTDKILITQLFGPDSVPNYDIVLKLFSIFLLLQNILISPLWPAYTDAFYRNDFLWIKKAIKKQFKIYVLFVIGIIILAILTKQIIKIWIGKIIEVPNMLILSFSIFTMISLWNNIFSYLLNAINILNIQVITAVIAMIINIPVSIIFVKVFNMGVYGIVFGTVLSLLLFAIAGPIEVFKYLKDK